MLQWGAATALDLYCPQYCVTSVTTAYLARESLGGVHRGVGRKVPWTLGGLALGGGLYTSAVNLADICVVVLEFWSLFLDLFTKINMCSSLVIIFVPFYYIDNCQHHIMTERFLLPGYYLGPSRTYCTYFTGSLSGVSRLVDGFWEKNVRDQR